MKKELLSVDKSSFFVGGDGGIRTHDPYVANVMLSQLSYTPMLLKLYHILSICQVLFGKFSRQSLSACRIVSPCAEDIVFLYIKRGTCVKRHSRVRRAIDRCSLCVRQILYRHFAPKLAG